MQIINNNSGCGMGSNQIHSLSPFSIMYPDQIQKFLNISNLIVALQKGSSTALQHWFSNPKTQQQAETLLMKCMKRNKQWVIARRNTFGKGSQIYAAISKMHAVIERLPLKKRS